jgi:hypothetical protein
MPVELDDFEDSTNTLYEQLIDDDDIDESQVEQILKGQVAQTVTQLFDNREQLRGDGQQQPIADE